MTLCAAEIAERATNWPTEYIEQTGSRVVTATQNNHFVLHRKDKGDYLVIQYVELANAVTVLSGHASLQKARDVLRAVAAPIGDSAFQNGEEE